MPYLDQPSFCYHASGVREEEAIRSIYNLYCQDQGLPSRTILKYYKKLYEGVRSRAYALRLGTIKK